MRVYLKRGHRHLLRLVDRPRTIWEGFIVKMPLGSEETATGLLPGIAGTSGHGPAEGAARCVDEPTWGELGSPLAYDDEDEWEDEGDEWDDEDEEWEDEEDWDEDEDWEEEDDDEEWDDEDEEYDEDEDEWELVDDDEEYDDDYDYEYEDEDDDWD